MFPTLPPHLYKSGGKVGNDWVIDFTAYSLILKSREVFSAWCIFGEMRLRGGTFYICKDHIILPIYNSY
jgi:hypothetical protein